MDELLEQFLIEGRELVAQAARDFATMARDRGDRTATDGAFRAIHTLKGSFAVFALGPAERLLHAAEDVLDRARKDAGTLDAAALASLIACLDQADRWIDAMERDGALPPDAEAVGARLITRLIASLEPASTAPAPTATEPVNLVRPDWTAALASREAAALAEAQTALVAFRYTPDADCFFRGEDPLAVVEAVPGLVALALLPTAATWPQPEDMEPFSCISVVEGLSEASEADVRAAFRLQPDQVEFAAIQGESESARTSANAIRKSSVRVEASRLDALADDLGDLVIAVNGLAPLASEFERTDRALATRLRSAHAGIQRATTALRHNLARVRLVPLEPALRRLPRIAREIAQGLDKDIAFTLTGETLEVDKQIADALFEPLLHLVRNAIDHGIEYPEQRRSLAKEAQGRVHLAFVREGDAITATLSDDGAGIDVAHVRRTAIARDVIAREVAEALDDAAALELIFRPGFSTASSVTEISGRGVGMDAVQAAVARLRGTITVVSEPGVGTRFHLRLPANALTTRLLVVEAGGERYGVSLDQVVETVRIEAAALMPLGTGVACVLRNRTVPVLDLARLLNTTLAESRHAKLVVTHVGGHPMALRVDGFFERIDTVVRPPRGILAAAPGVIGSALLGDGGVLIVLDLPALAA